MTQTLRIVAVAATLFLITPMANAGPCHDQPNMAAALESLKQAREELLKAEHNKGGWRDAAIKAINEAISQTDRGCAFADNH
ncbi:MAG: hypothetical protein OSA97_21005 [Nevskia sp.]|nr:hypothetical protein [Nevskia sp.]